MADTTLLLNGFSILGDPKTNANASNGGEFMVHDGEAVFEADDIVMFQVENANPDGSLNEDSVIVGIVVYDNASDYYNGAPKYTYSSPTGAPVDTGRKAMGDRYLEFDASSLTSSDPTAPELDELALFGGVDIFAALESSGPYEIPTHEDIDYDGDGIISPEETGDGIFSSEISLLTVICYRKGTMISTPQEPRPIEQLGLGDKVSTLDHGDQEIRWIGSMKTAGVGSNAPVLIRAGALGNVRDLWVSQNHRMLVTGARAELLFGQSEVLVAAKHLVDGAAIRIVPCAEVEYFHLLCDAHQIVFAEACPSETLLPGRQALNSVSAEERDEIVALFPELALHDAGASSRYTLKKYEAEALLRAA